MAETRLVQERIRQAIVVLRGHRVMLDADLSILYQVEDPGCQAEPRPVPR